jgi:hypothetical protein
MMFYRTLVCYIGVKAIAAAHIAATGYGLYEQRERLHNIILIFLSRVCMIVDSNFD